MLAHSYVVEMREQTIITGDSRRTILEAIFILVLKLIEKVYTTLTKILYNEQLL